MKYTCRPGVILTRICGEWLLIPTREASQYSPCIMRLTFPAMLAWRILKKNRSEEDICRALQIFFHCGEEEARWRTEAMLMSFEERNLIIPVESTT